MNDCATCAAKDRHIETLEESNRQLLEQNRQLLDRMLEVTQPGALARVAMAGQPRPEREKRPASGLVTHNAGRLATVRAANRARATERPPAPAPNPEAMRDAIERSFATDIPDAPAAPPEATS